MVENICGLHCFRRMTFLRMLRKNQFLTALDFERKIPVLCGQKKRAVRKKCGFFGLTFWSMKLTALELFRFVGLKGAKLQKIVDFQGASGKF